MGKPQGAEMSNSSKLPIMKAAYFSWQFALATWPKLLPAFLVKALLTGLGMYAILQSQVSSGGFGLPAMLVMFGAEVACLTMALRLAVRNEYAGFMGVSIGADEGRLALANLMYSSLMFLVFLICGFLAFLTATVFLWSNLADPTVVETDPEAVEQALTAALQTPVGKLVAVVCAGFVVAPLLWLYARLITFPAATIGMKKITIFQTWTWTKGHTLAVVAAIIVTVGPFFALTEVGRWLVTQALGLKWMLLWSDADIIALTKMQAGVIGISIGLLSIPMSIVSAGLSAFMYSGFKPDTAE